MVVPQQDVHSKKERADVGWQAWLLNKTQFGESLSKMTLQKW